MRSRLFPALGALLLCSGQIFAQDAKPELPWTFMVYGAADNNADGPILEFLESVRTALDDDPGMELILFIDRSEGFSDDARFLGSDFTGGRVYRLRKDAAELLDASEYFPGMTPDAEFEVDSSDPRNLGQFVAFCKDRFPARRYGLMIYSHANGATMCPDDESGRSMPIPALTDQVGVEAAVDFLALELCYMGGVEIAYQWRPGNGGFSADVLLAIPNAGSPLDWDRAFARIRTPGHELSVKGTALDPRDLTAEAFGRLVVEEGYAGRRAYFERMLREHPAEAKAALAAGDDVLRESAGCYDLSRATAVKSAVDRLAVELAAVNGREILDEFRGSADAVKMMNYAQNGRFRSRPYVDLYELLERTAGSPDLDEAVQSAANEAMEAVDGLVLASFGMEEGFENFRPGRNGVFIVFPDGASPARMWQDMDWYTPLKRKGDSDPYGNWAFLADGATQDNGEIENWFELLDLWFDDPSAGPAGLNGYSW